MSKCRTLSLLLWVATLLVSPLASLEARAENLPSRSSPAQSVAGVVNAPCSSENLLVTSAQPVMSGISGNGALVTDGAIPPEGTDWDAIAAVVLESTESSITFDLSSAREVRALFLQADANDSYDVWASDTGESSSYRLIAELPIVVERGHGLRNRTVKIAPTSTRFLRVTAGKGDGAYSVSEFAAYCQPPEPFPPTLAVAATTSGSAPPLPPPLPRESVSESHGHVWLKAAGLLAIVAGSIELARRRAVARERAVENTERATWAHRLLCALFFTSGCAALVYEVVWFHLLRLVIGASALSMAIVVASFMGGMFLGSLLFARVVRRSHNPVVIYALLELGVGIFGLSMPLVLPAVQKLYIGFFGYGALGIALRAVVAAILLLPPTALMGATLPAIARRYEQGRRGMSKLTSLYAANTLGAVVGCLVSAFYLLAYFDVWVATGFAVVLNIGVGIVGWSLRDRLLSPVEISARPRAGASDVDAATRRAVYLVAALSGLTSLGAQVIWTRLLTLLFGASVYAFAIILAVFLAGLGIGSAWASRLLRRGARATTGLMLSQLALVPTILLGGYLLAAALPYGSPPGWVPMRALHVLDVVRAVVVVLPATICWGASFPLALAAVGSDHDDAGRSTGFIYASNTIGAIVGALGVSFWSIPALGTHRSSQALIMIAAASAAALLITGRSKGAVRDGEPGRGEGLRTGVLWVLALGACGVGLLPPFPREFLAHGRYLVWVDERDRYPYVSEGAASTVAVHVAPDGYSNFHVSGRVEATNNPNDLRTERLIGHISAFTHPNPKSVLVVGLGAGITAGALTLHPEVERIVICEIEPRVVGATNQFSKENYAVLSNPKVQLVFDDARHFLATTREQFDIITSDPIHPWVRGNSILFSKEYYAIVKAHLKPGGLASQWVPLYETSELAIQIQAKTFMDAFADGTVWNTITNNRGYDVVFVGTNQPLRVDVTAVEERIDRNPALQASLREVKLGSAYSLLSTYGTNGRDMAAWLDGIPVNRDFSLKLEYISGLAMNSHHADAIYANMIARRSFPDQLFTGKPESIAELKRRIFGD